jgi:hypothetical protein
MTAILCLLLSTLVTPQQPPRDAAGAPATGSARISGVVLTDERAPRSLRRVIVTLSGSALRVSRSTITNEEGRFSFGDLPAGRYTITAARKAYLTSAFGASYPGGAGTPVSVASASHVDDIRITLPKGAVVTGVITDASGIPIPSLTVNVHRVTPDGYERAGEGATDDRGVYRVYGLSPAEYVIAAVPRPTGGGDMGVRSASEVDAILGALERRGSAATTAARPGEIAPEPDLPTSSERTYSFAPFYYPGTAAAAEATRITVAPGEERGGLDFPLAVVPTATLTGVVTGSDGQPARDVQITVVPIGPPLTLVLGTGATGPMRTGPDGTFRRSSITPGTYRLLARRVPPAPPRSSPFGAATPVAGRGPTTEWALTEITVNGADIDGIALTLRPGLGVRGWILFEGTSEVPSNLSALRVILTPLTASARSTSTIPSSLKADGSFEITNLLPGSYRFDVTLPPEVGERWWPRSALSGERDVLDLPLELSDGTGSEVVLTLSDRRPSLTGGVRDADDRPVSDAFVVIFSADRTHWRPESRRVRAVRPATDGRYEATDLSPGEYLVAAVRRPPPNAWLDARFLERLTSSAVRVALSEGERGIRDLHVHDVR